MQITLDAVARSAAVIALVALAGGCASSSEVGADDAPTTSTTNATPTGRRAASDPCARLSAEDVRRVLAVDAGRGTGSPVPPLCTFAFRSASGVTTDLVVGPSPMDPQSLTSADFPGHQRQALVELGDDAVYFRADSIDNGNSTLFVALGDRAFLIASEFVTKQQAEQLAKIVLGNW